MITPSEMHVRQEVPRYETDLIEISGGVDFDKAADICLKYMDTGTL